jgi:acyl dehydratase
VNDAAPINPRGIFDRSTKGLVVGPITVSVERGRIRFFAEVLGNTDPVHFDVEAARKAGHPDLVAPPSFLMVIESLAGDEIRRRNLVSAAALAGCDFRYLLHGDERYEYVAPIYAGEDVQISTRVVDFYDRKGGAMEFVSLETEIASEKRGVLVRGKRTLLHRLPEA